MRNGAGQGMPELFRRWGRHRCRTFALLVVDRVRPWGVVLAAGRRLRDLVYAAEALGVASGQAPSSVPLVFPAELLFCRRITTRPGPVAHGSQFRRGKQLQLRHAFDYPRTQPKSPPRTAVDHFK
ncbi:hypothetical protein [Dactylosporangium sp. NPDC051484]|uniref:hypothetical protein n=1 Tax=Dactylosporangium sp. NPDC051484 TaxID=3154942 RepID=UPI00344BD2BF